MLFMTTKMIRSLVSIAACFCLARPALAWNAEGHMVVAQIAYNHLDPAVKATCDALIAVPLSFSSTSTSNFVTAAVWADDFKTSLGTGTSHYIDLPIILNGPYSTNDAPPGVPNVVTALNQYIATLQNNSAALTDRATALRYVLHFAGDIQQPLHASNGISTNTPPPDGDAGGNGFNLTGHWSELHALWDDGGGWLPNDISRPLTPTSQAALNAKAAIAETAYPYTFSVGSIPDPMTWAWESYGIAATVAYVGITNNTTPTVSYTNTAQITTIQRMAIGGQRLAKLLNMLGIVG
jgi:hypothetical protein